MPQCNAPAGAGRTGGAGAAFTGAAAAAAARVLPAQGSSPGPAGARIGQPAASSSVSPRAESACFGRSHVSRPMPSGSPWRASSTVSAQSAVPTYSDSLHAPDQATC